METTGVLSHGRDSDSSYAVSGTSSAGTARDTPKPKSTQRMRIEHGLLIKDALPANSGTFPSWGVLLNERELLFREAWGPTQ
jgi:hypothetical protein